MTKQRNLRYEIEAKKPFAESRIWQINREYYHQAGVNAWRQGEVPHHLTSNAMVGKTYAELILAFFKDLVRKGQTDEKVYILELGAGHGRLAFHILEHLERLIEQVEVELPAYCYILSDIVEDNLSFFDQHPQFQSYFEKGLLDSAYFDAIEGQELLLRHSGLRISPQTLHQPLLAIANYFFDSIPNDLFYFKNRKIWSCWLALHSEENPEGMDEATLLENTALTYTAYPLKPPFYQKDILNEILEEYRNLVFHTYLFFPEKSLQCVDSLQKMSQKGLMLLTMDKGSRLLSDLDNAKSPEMVTHGSLSFSVNYHAFEVFCERQGGTAYFPSFSTSQSELGCLLFLKESNTYRETKAVYQRVVNDFGPADFNIIKKFSYEHIATMRMMELIAILRLGAYDSTLFINFLTRIKQLCQIITNSERLHLSDTMHQTWKMYFTINEAYDLPFEIGGILYQLAFYREALDYFKHSVDLYGQTADGFYNKALCHYQLREDALFLETVAQAKVLFPDYAQLVHLSGLDLGAA